VLLDELEKAHPDVAGILLQIMEEGCLTDSTGRRVSFRNAIVVMTTNVGGEIRSDGLGFSPAGRTGETEKSLRHAFAPEFLGRLDQTVYFHPLDHKSMECIARKYLLQLYSRARTSGLELELPEELPALLGDQSQKSGGARSLRRLIQDRVEGPLSEYLLKSGKKLTKVKVHLSNGELLFQ
jgi:ATP-dependent Clp protease ATP-binding subunit ClpB